VSNRQSRPTEIGFRKYQLDTFASGYLQMKKGGVIPNMKMKLDEKKALVDDLKENLLKTKVLIVADYKGLDVASMTDLRKKLREANLECKVVKNTLLKRAAQETDIAVLSDFLKGPNAVIFSYDDPVAPAKVLIDFAKNNKNLDIKKGVLKGKLLDPEDIKSLSELPSKDVLLGQLLSVMTAVPTSVVRVLSGVPRKMLNVLQAIKEQKEAA
jgi:large subunit ribosomal protein L10